jgi:dTDP-4-amino-4,6-dideoxygalactose transaminase
VRSKDRFLVFGAPQIQDAEIDEVVASMRAAWLGTGPKVARFEDAFRAYKHAPHAVAVNSCTAALHLSLLAAGIGPGDEVITSAMTFAATVNVIIHAGATPVIVDVAPDSMNLDLAAVSEAITPTTRAIIPVHFAGRPVDMDSLMGIAESHGLVVIEDCAHAIETEWRGQPAGTFGEFGCFSFYATKNLTTGEGGMILTKREEDANRLKVLALHGMSKDAWRRFSDDGYRHYQVIEAGFKYNMMDLQAAIGIHQLERIEANWERRRAVWARYQAGLAGSGLRLPSEPEPETRHGYHLFTVLVDEGIVGISRDEFLDAMTAHGIGVGVHYLSIPEHPYYRERFAWSPEMVPQAARIGQQTVSLPLSARLGDRDVDDVIEAIYRVTG